MHEVDAFALGKSVREALTRSRLSRSRPSVRGLNPGEVGIGCGTQVRS